MSETKSEFATKASQKATSTLQRSDALIRKLAVFIAIVISVTCLAVVVVAFNTAAAVKQDAEADKKLAKETKAIAEINQHLLEQSKPCITGDPPESPACVQAKRTAALVDDVVNRIAEQQAVALSTHDLNTHNEHVVLRNLLKSKAAAPHRTAITAPPRQVSSGVTNVDKSVATTAPSPAPVTTTTCPKKGKTDKCK